MDHDEPNYVSAVTDSAFLLRENISKTLEKYPGVPGPMRKYAMLLRDEIKDFLDRGRKRRTKSRHHTKRRGHRSLETCGALRDARRRCL
jgi:hypothetical protein